MDWLLDDSQLEGFHWRTGSKRDTTGIWIWGEPIMIEAVNGETYAVVLVRTAISSCNFYCLQESTTEFCFEYLNVESTVSKSLCHCTYRKQND